MLNGFFFSRLKINLRLLEKTPLPPFLGSTLTGGSKRAFRKTLCPLTEEECEKCRINTNCVFAYLFLTPKDKKANPSYQYEKYPHPFVIEPPLNFSENEDRLSFNLILIGKVLDYLPYFLLAFERLRLGEKRIKCLLASVIDDLSSEGNIIYDGERKRFIANYKVKRFAEIYEEYAKEISFLTINFLTPTRIKYRGEHIKDLDFSIFIKRLLARILVLSEYHCQTKSDIPYDYLLEKAKRIKVLESGVKWQRHPSRWFLTGLLGKISFGGELRDFLPLIKLGEYLHIGNNTSFGLGKYEIQY